ncbi:thiolase family protein [Candidatus Woesearchaeota archaeon]|nr:thiolase family protein [Candidatus Woesearchaeota archaeon]
MYIKGTGMTKFGTSDKFSHQLAYQATQDALKDADTKFKDIDAVICSSLEFFSSIEKQRHFASMLSSMFKTNKPIIRVPAACAGGGNAVWFANQLGYDKVLVVGAEKLMTMKSSTITDEFMMAAEPFYEQPEGLNFPAQNAAVAQEYMFKYPETTHDHLALIAHKNHHNGFLNPKAKFFGKKVSLETIKNAPMVCSPLRLYDCSISVDGAAALVLTKDKTDIEIAGSDMCNDFLPSFERADNTSWDATKIASKNAYGQAKLTPEDINIAEVHDAFTSVELIAYEDLGFAKPGTAYKKIEAGYFNLDGKLPVNTSGGLKAKGHPISATGVAQMVEITQQLRNQAGDRQVTGAKIGLCQNIGGAGAIIATHILKKIGG